MQGPQTQTEPLQELIPANIHQTAEQSIITVSVNKLHVAITHLSTSFSVHIYLYSFCTYISTSVEYTNAALSHLVSLVVCKLELGGVQENFPNRDNKVYLILSRQTGLLSSSLEVFIFTSTGFHKGFFFTTERQVQCPWIEPLRQHDLDVTTKSSPVLPLSAARFRTSSASEN